MGDMEDKARAKIRKQEEADKKACLVTYGDAAIRKTVEYRLAHMPAPTSGDVAAHRNALMAKTVQEGITYKWRCLQDAKDKARRGFKAVTEQEVKKEGQAPEANKK